MKPIKRMLEQHLYHSNTHKNIPELTNRLKFEFLVK